MLVTKKLSNNNTWININSDEITKHSKVYEEYDIDPKTLEYALDENEHAHMDYDREDGTVTFIYSVLDLEKDKEYYETVPLTFIVQKNRLVTISNEDNVYIIQKMCDYVDGKENLSIYTLLFPMPTIRLLNAWISRRMKLTICFGRKPRRRTSMLFPIWKWA